MGFFDKLFRGRKNETPNIVLGRYSDAYKLRAHNDIWDRAQELFDEEQYLESYITFLSYLRNDNDDNLTYEMVDEEQLNFVFYQGSRKIQGFANNEKLVAYSRIARVEEIDASLFDRLLRKNFDLNYARFAIDDYGYLTIKFDTYTSDGAPYKLFNALKELALNADKQDDLIGDEMKIDLVNIRHVDELSLREKEVKYAFLKQEIQKIAHPIIDNGRNVEAYLGGVSYHLLNTVYKLDYLVRPEGVMMETLERIHRSYFEEDAHTADQKILDARREFSKLIARGQRDFFKEMYLTKSTFSIMVPVSHDRVSLLIEEEMRNIDWYEENDYEDTALAITGYIVGYCLFSYTIPLPDKALFELYYFILEAPYFESLGVANEYFKRDGSTLRKKNIKRAIKAIVKEHQSNYDNLDPDLSLLDFSNKVSFAKTYLLMIQQLNFRAI